MVVQVVPERLGDARAVSGGQVTVVESLVYETA
jgi:hypothetical protein